MMQVVALPGGRAASYEVIGGGWPALMFAGGPGFSASYMNGDAELLSDVLCSYLIDPHGSGSSTPACISPLTCAHCWAASPAPRSSWPANSTSSAAPRKLSRSPPPLPGPSLSCFPAAATYPASKYPSTTAARSRNSSAAEPRGNSRSQPTRQPGMLASYHQPGNRSGNTRPRRNEVRWAAIQPLAPVQPISCDPVYGPHAQASA